MKNPEQTRVEVRSADPRRIVYIIDDEPRVGRSITNLLSSICVPSRLFPSTDDYIKCNCRLPDIPSCLLLDINLVEINGMALQRSLNDEQHPPIICLSGYEKPCFVQVMKSGVVEVLPKPFNCDDLLQAIYDAFKRDVESRSARDELKDLYARFIRLTPREREVFSLLISGLLNKRGAAELGISEIACQVHCGQIMRKMSAGSFTDLVRMGAKLGSLAKRDLILD